MEWIKIEAGEYWSKDERFHIIKAWDRIYGLHWELLDIKTNIEHSCNSLKHCKQIAENINLNS